MDIPTEIQLEIIEKLDIKSLNNLLKTNKYYRKLLDSYYTFFSNLLLNKHKINYKDSYNYIFLINNVRQNWFREDPYNPKSKYNLLKIIELSVNAEGKVIIFEYHNGYIVDRPYESPEPPEFMVKTDQIRINRKNMDDSDYPLQMLIQKLKNKKNKTKKDKESLIEAYKALLFGIYDFKENQIVEIPWTSEKSELIDANMHEEAEELEYIWELAFYPNEMAI